ncbi:MAG: hypothetical protein ACJAWT_000703 [Glaciecola sp.]|jgi:hypothetical protein
MLVMGISGVFGVHPRASVYYKIKDQPIIIVIITTRFS